MKASLLKAIYPVLMKLGKWFRSTDAVRRPSFPGLPNLPFSSLSVILNQGQEFSFASLQGKKVLIVNTASYCGYTGQLQELETLYKKYKGKLEIIAFPSNDFKQQEPGDDAQIAEFCRLNYNTSFRIARKSVVRKLPGQHPVFRWLTEASLNGWNDREPGWNFCKYLIGSSGELEAVYAQTVSPAEIEL